MIRVVFFHASLFFAPFIAYAFYLYFQNRDVMQRDEWERRTTFWLLVVGLVLLIASFFAFSAFNGAGTDKHYVPARYEDGKIIPGHYE